MSDTVTLSREVFVNLVAALEMNHDHHVACNGYDGSALHETNLKATAAGSAALAAPQPGKQATDFREMLAAAS